MRIRRRPDPPPKPDPPVNVRIVYDNGDVVPCELVYEGESGGHHSWIVVNVTLDRRRLSRVEADALPGNTSVHFPTR